MIKIDSVAATVFLIVFFWIFIVSSDYKDIGFGTDNNMFFRYVPVIGSSIVLVLLKCKKNLASRINTFFLSVLTLFICLGIGSLVTLNNNGILLEETYLGRTLNIIPFFASYFFFRSVNVLTLETFSRKLIKLHIFFALLYSSLIFYLYFTNQLFSAVTTKRPFHENISLIIPVAVLIINYFKNSSYKYFLAFFVIVAGLSIWKNTSFLVLLVTGIMFFHLKFRKLGVSINYIRLFFFLGLVVSLPLLIYFQQYFIDVLPGGGTSVRFRTYGQRLEEFISSPILGSFFMGSPIVTVAWLSIPSHSDILDILSLGGIFAGTLFLTPFILVGFKSISNYLELGEGNLSSLFYYNLIGNYTWVVVLFFNPILELPRMAFFLWFGLGILLGINERRKNIQYW